MSISSLRAITDTYEIYNNTTHQRILFDGILILKTYDHRAGSYVQVSLPGL